MVESFGGRGGGGGRDGGRMPGNNGWGNSNWSMDTLFKNTDISEKTQAHLFRVYSTLLTGTGVCAGGMWLNSTFVIQGFLMMIVFMVAFAVCTYQVRNPNNSENT